MLRVGGEGEPLLLHQPKYYCNTPNYYCTTQLLLHPERTIIASIYTVKRKNGFAIITGMCNNNRKVIIARKQLLLHHTRRSGFRAGLTHRSGVRQNLWRQGHPTRLPTGADCSNGAEIRVLGRIANHRSIFLGDEDTIHA